MKVKFAATVGVAALVIAFAFNAARAANSTTPAQAAPATHAPAAPKVDPRADKLLTQMCEVLGSAPAFTFHAEVLFDQVLPSAVKIQYAGEINFAVQRPHELAIDFQSDLGGKDLWYHGDKLTILDPPHGVYASLAVPNTLDAALDQVAAMHNLKLPLANFAYSNPCIRVQRQIIFGAFIGVNDVNGVACDHLAFSSSKADLQLWLDRSGKPLPRKMVINYRTEPGSPEYIAFLSDWKFPAHIADSHFRPKLPAGAKKIEFLKVKEPQP
jgi:hypothetical protein